MATDRGGLKVVGVGCVVGFVLLFSLGILLMRGEKYKTTNSLVKIPV